MSLISEKDLEAACNSCRPEMFDVNKRLLAAVRWMSKRPGPLAERNLREAQEAVEAVREYSRTCERCGGL